MSTQVLRRKGSTLAHSTFIGGSGELTVDLDKNVAVVHNAAQLGGFPLAGTMFPNVFSQPQTISLPAGTPTAAALSLVTDSLARVTFRQDGFGVFHRQEPDTGLGGFDFTKQGTTGNALAALSSGSGIAGLNFRGFDGVAMSGTAASIRVFTSEAWTAAAHGTKLFFLTTPIGSTTVATQATLDSTAFTLSVPAFINSIANSNALRIDSYSVTGANAQQLASLAGTWNTTGDPIAIHLNILDTASGALSKLLDLQTNSVSRFSVSKVGDVVMTGSLGTLSELTLADSALLKWNTRSVISSPANGVLRLTNNAQTDFTRLQFGGITSAFPAIGRSGINLEILGADGAGPSGLYIYNTKTSATNFERLDIQWTANVAQIWTEKGSVGGAARHLLFGTDATARLVITAAGVIGWGLGLGTSTLETDGSLIIDTELLIANVTTGIVDIATVFSADRGGQAVGFFGTTAAQQDVVLLDNQVAPGGSADTLDDIPINAGTAAAGIDTVDRDTVPDKATVENIFEIVRNDTYQLGLKVNQIITALENYGLLIP